MKGETPEALLLGGTGRTGRYVALALQARGLLVRALVRDAASAKAVLPTGTELVPGTLQAPAILNEAAFGVDVVVFAATAIGARDSHPADVDAGGVARAADAALHGKAGHFVLMSSASVTQPEHPHNVQFNNVLKYKGEGEEALRSCGMDYTIVRALGLRDRPPGLCGVRMLQGDRIAFGEDIARPDVAAFLADVACLFAGGGRGGFLEPFGVASLKNATLEIYNDGRVPPGRWVCAQPALLPDPLHE